MGDFTTTRIYGDLLVTGEGLLNAQTATKLATARTISVSGAVTGSVNFDGSANITISTTATSDPTLTLNGDVSGSATFTNLGNATLTATVANDSHTHDTRYYTESEFTDAATANKPMIRNSSGDVWCRLFRSTYSSTNSSIAAIYTTQTIGGDYMRPSTIAQVKSALGSMPASDVYAWAKASTKPSYTYSEVGAAASSHDHDGRYVKEGGTAFSGTYPIVARIGAENFYSNNGMQFTGSSNTLAVSGNITVAGQSVVKTNDSRLSDTRTPSDNSVTYAKVHSSLTNRITDNDGAWNFDNGIIDAAISANTTVSFSNVRQNKTLKVRVVITNSATLTLPTSCTILDGSAEASGINGTYYFYFDAWSTSEILVSIAKAL